MNRVQFDSGLVLQYIHDAVKQLIAQNQMEHQLSKEDAIRRAEEQLASMLTALGLHFLTRTDLEIIEQGFLKTGIKNPSVKDVFTIIKEYHRE